jgi:hypothetical protein
MNSINEDEEEEEEGDDEVTIKPGEQTKFAFV